MARQKYKYSIFISAFMKELEKEECFSYLPRRAALEFCGRIYAEEKYEGAMEKSSRFDRPEAYCIPEWSFMQFRREYFLFYCAYIKFLEKYDEIIDCCQERTRIRMEDQKVFLDSAYERLHELSTNEEHKLWYTNKRYYFRRKDMNDF